MLWLERRRRGRQLRAAPVDRGRQRCGTRLGLDQNRPQSRAVLGHPPSRRSSRDSGKPRQADDRTACPARLPTKHLRGQRGSGTMGRPFRHVSPATRTTDHAESVKRHSVLTCSTDPPSGDLPGHTDYADHPDRLPWPAPPLASKPVPLTADSAQRQVLHNRSETVSQPHPVPSGAWTPPSRRPGRCTAA